MLYEYVYPTRPRGLALGALEHQPVAWSVREPTAPTIARLAQSYLDSLGDVKRFLRHRYGLSRADAEDICQELCVRLIKYGRGAGIEDPRAYMRRVAVNVLQDMRCRPQQKLSHEPEWIDELVSDSAGEPERMLERSDEIRSVAIAIRFLSGRQQRFIELRFERGLSYNEIAAEAGVSARTALRELTRAYAKLREMIEPGRKHRRNSRTHGSR